MGDQLKGLSFEEAKGMLKELALIHSYHWNSPELRSVSHSPLIKSSMAFSIADDRFEPAMEMFLVRDSAVQMVATL